MKKSEPGVPKRTKRTPNSAPSEQVVPHQMDLIFETWLPINPLNATRYPSLFARTAIFEPTKNRQLADTKGWNPEDADVYYVGELRIERYGPGLSMYDEDTLIAVLQLLSQRSLKGPLSKLNQELCLPAGNDMDEVDEIYVGSISPYKVNQYLGRPVGGPGLEACQASIKRLGLTKLTIYSDASQKHLSLHFFEHLADYRPEEATYFKISPFMVRLLADYMIFDVTIRRKLSDVGKAVHRYLSAQPAEHRVALADLMADIRYNGSIKEFKRALSGDTKTVGQLELLVGDGWLVSYDILGTGRASPFVLHTYRAT